MPSASIAYAPAGEPWRRSRRRARALLAVSFVVASLPLAAAKHLAQAASEAQAAGDHRRAARLYMHAVLALTGVLPPGQVLGTAEESSSATAVAPKSTDVL